MRNLILTSCGIINEDFKKDFYGLVTKEELQNKRLLYITTVSDEETDDDKSLMEAEFKTILELGISENNIVEYKIGRSNIDINNFDIMYMMGVELFIIKKYNCNFCTTIN